MCHYSKRSVRDMSLSERVHKLFFSERSLRTLQLRLELLSLTPVSKSGQLSPSLISLMVLLLVKYVGLPPIKLSLLNKIINSRPRPLVGATEKD